VHLMPTQELQKCPGQERSSKPLPLRPRRGTKPLRKSNASSETCFGQFWEPSRNPCHFYPPNSSMLHDRDALIATLTE
jgi:hypothetical protein